MSNLTPPSGASKSGHRRVRSLAREFEDISYKHDSSLSSPSSPPSGPSRDLTPSPSPSPSRFQTTSPVRRQATLSQPLLSPPITYKSSAFTSGPNIRKSSGDLPSPSLATPKPLPTPVSGAAVSLTPVASSSKPSPSHSPSSPSPTHRRKASVFVSPMNAQSTPPPPVQSQARSPPPPQQRPQHKETTTTATTLKADDDAEEDDLFLPLSPPSASNSFVVPRASPSPSPSSSPEQHRRSHSRIHERNLSAFFPRPGHNAGAGYGDTFQDPHSLNGNNSNAPTVDISSRQSDKTPPVTGRRGHHHRHSASVPYFSFLDQQQQLDQKKAQDASPDLTSSPSLHSIGDIFVPDSPAPRALPFPSSAAHHHIATRNSPYAALASLPLRVRLALAVALFQIALGATLWVRGQAGESLAVTGLGYLVVFDGLGALSGVLVEGRGAGSTGGLWMMWRGVGGSGRSHRFPFGTRRLVTLSHFSQAIYLLFSAVYVCKESVEHVLLLHSGVDDEGAHTHGAGHAAMSHAGGGETPGGSGSLPGIKLPVVLLTVATMATLVSALGFQNHQSLAETVAVSGPIANSTSSSSGSSGPSSSSSSSSSEVPRRSALQATFNPFTLTILVFAAGLASISYFIPAAQLAPLDKVVALLQSIAMFYIAYPAAVATGQVLLQTSPPEHSRRMILLAQGVQDIENHPQVVSVARPHVWQLDSPGSAPPGQTVQSGGGGVGGAGSNAGSIVVTLSIEVDAEASDEDLVALTQFARDRCAKAAGKGLGEMELTVAVARARPAATQGVRFFGKPSAAAASGHSHSHSHSHSQSHNGGHGGHGHSR